MNFFEQEIPGVFIIEPNVHKDERGYFFESYRDDLLSKKISKNIKFIQENESYSSYGTLRGLHFQIEPFAQTKLVRVISGQVLDVIVDLRQNSSFFGKHLVFRLDSESKQQLFIPKGFAHGFVVESPSAIFSYKVDNLYSPEHERGIHYQDPDLDIDWGNIDNIIVSSKDNLLPLLSKALDSFEC